MGVKVNNQGRIHSMHDNAPTKREFAPIVESVATIKDRCLALEEQIKVRLYPIMRKDANKATLTMTASTNPTPMPPFSPSDLQVDLGVVSSTLDRIGELMDLIAL